MATVAEMIRGGRSGAVPFDDAGAGLSVAPVAEVDAALGAALRDAFDRLFRGGWQPAELYRVVARRGNPLQGDLVAGAARHAAAASELLDPRWSAQVAELPGAARPGVD